jgi:hypothetical protein
VITRSTADFTDPHLSFVSYSRLKINIYEQADQSLFLDTGNHALDQITKPAVFLRDSLIASLNAMRTNRIASISEAQAEHLQMLFDFLVASAHTASVDSITKQYSNSSGTKLLDRSFPTSESKGMIVQRGGTSSSSIVEAFLPASLEEISMTLNTVAGTVKAKILSARSYTDATTLAITFEYLGDTSLGLSAFAVDYMSHELVSCFHVVSCSPRPTTEQVIYTIRRIYTTILPLILINKPQQVSKSGASNKWIFASIAMGLITQKWFHFVMDAKSLRGDIDAQRYHLMVDVACDDIDQKFGFIQLLLWDMYENCNKAVSSRWYHYNPLRDAVQDWVKVAFKDVNSVEFVKDVASLGKENSKFIICILESDRGLNYIDCGYSGLPFCLPTQPAREYYAACCGFPTFVLAF